MQQVGLRVVLQRYLEASQPAAERERGPGQVAGPPGGRRLPGRAEQHLPGRGDVAGELQYLTKLHGDGDRLGRPAGQRGRNAPPRPRSRSRRPRRGRLAATRQRPSRGLAGRRRGTSGTRAGRPRRAGRTAAQAPRRPPRAVRRAVHLTGRDRAPRGRASGGTGTGPGQPSLQHLPHTRWHRERRRGSSGGGQPGHLLHEKRVAAGPGAQGRRILAGQAWPGA